MGKKTSKHIRAAAVNAERHNRREKHLDHPDLEIFIYPVGPVIGAHCGPGLVASAFIGKERP